MTQRFEFDDGKSRKFWQVAQQGSALHIAWGKLDTNGQSQIKAFDTDAKASAAKAKLIAEKTGKGYVAAGSANAPVVTSHVARAPAATLADQAASRPEAALASWAGAPQGDAQVGGPAHAKLAANLARTDQADQADCACTNADWSAAALAFDAQALSGVMRLIAFLQAELPLSAHVSRADAKRIMQVPEEAVSVAMYAVSEFFSDGWWREDGARYQPLEELESVSHSLRLLEHALAPGDGCANATASPDVIANAQRLLGVNLRHQWQTVLADAQNARQGADVGPWLGARHAVPPPLIVHATGPDGRWLSDVSQLTQGPRAAAWPGNTETEAHWFAVQLNGNHPNALSQCLAALKPSMSHFTFDACLHALARMPRVDAFEALLAELNERPVHLHEHIHEVLDAAIARWPFVAVVGLTRVLANARKTSPLRTMADQLRLDATLARLEPVLPQLADVLAPWLSEPQRSWLAQRCARWAEPADVAPAQALPAALAQPPWQAAASTTPSPVNAPCAVTLPAVPPQMDWPQGERAQVLDGYGSPLPTGQEPLDVRLTALGFVQMHAQPEAKLRAEQALAAGDVAQLVAVWRAAVKVHRKTRGLYTRGFDQFALPHAMALPFWNAVAAELDQPDEAVWLSQWGLAALPGLIALVARRPADNLQMALRFGSTELALPAARAAFRSKKSAQAGRDWLLRWPEHAAAGVLPVALGDAGEAEQLALEALQFLAANGQGPLLRTVAQRVPDTQRPAVLARLDAIVQSDPLSWFPATMASLPAHWRPRAWRRPRLIQTGGKAHDGGAGQPLGNDALTALGQMMSFPRTDGVYAGLTQVQRACNAQSLADFAWDGFLAWLAAGAPAANNWALSTLGLFGNDDIARQLTPFIRAWPGESAHARAVMGLDVLEAIGSDTALMQLHGIAQKLKFKGLQDSAQQKIVAIANRLGLSTAELEDRLAPDLGLDAQGALVLDFGPRQFKVGFDEALKPWVRDFTDGKPGARLKDLPKPNKADDAALAAAATARYKDLKKDAKTIAAQQIQRLETAMCQQRRWSEGNFQTFIAQHPLVRHIAKRLVWGVFGATALNDSGNLCIPQHDREGDAADDEGHRTATSPSDGGPLLGCFRLDEDARMRSANDEAFVMPAAPNAPAAAALCIGVVHPLHLTAALRDAFAQSFADYELLQPFEQLARAVHAMAPPEGDQLALTRWQRRTVTSGRLMGLFARGWVRGAVQSGFITHAHKPLDNGGAIALHFAPGLMVGDMDPSAPQTLGSLVWGAASSWGDVPAAQQRPWGELGAVAFSEVVRDLCAVSGE